MSKKPFIIIIVITLTLVIIAPSHAFRCGNEIVSRWETTSETIAKCGQPYSKGSGYQNINGQTQYVEQWFYNCGDNDFIYSISISDNKIIRIDPIKRGSGKGQCNK